MYPDLAEQWHPRLNGNLTPMDVTPGSRRIVWWLCARGHSWRTAVKNKVKGAGCYVCLGQN